MVDSCYFHNNTGDALKKVANSNQVLTVIGSIFASNGRGVVGVAGINFTTLERNSFYAQTTDAVNLTPTGTTYAGTLFSIANNIFYGNGGWGMNLNANLNPQYLLYNRSNAYGSNTSGNHDANLGTGIGDVTLTANPFNNPAGGDFSLNSTPGGGAVCKQAGFQYGT
jgi:hypothetical protein